MTERILLRNPSPATLPAALRRLLGDDACQAMPAELAGAFPLLHLPEGAVLLHEGAPARTVYLVQAGHFKTLRNGEDGYEQVIDFVGTDGLLGCDGLATGLHASAAVALEESWVVALRIPIVVRLCQQLPSFTERWHAALAAQLVAAGDRVWVMSAVGAEKRVARFVLQALRQQAADDVVGHRLHLPMCRRDLGSHLGLSHESVSRAFTLLDSAGLLRVHNRELQVLDAAALAAFTSNTRGYAASRREPGCMSTVSSSLDETTAV